MRRIPEIGTLYRHKPTGVVFVFDGEPGDLFVRNMFGLHRPDFTERREVSSYHFEQEYEPLTMFGGSVVIDPTMRADEIVLRSGESEARLKVKGGTTAD